MRLCNKPKMIALKTLVKASFKNTHSDKKISVTPLKVTMNIVTGWKSKRTETVRKHKRNMQHRSTLEDKWDECDNIYIMCPLL